MVMVGIYLKNRNVENKIEKSLTKMETNQQRWKIYAHKKISLKDLTPDSE